MKEVIEIAQREIGYKSTDEGAKYFIELFPGEHQMPWCVPFIEWIFREAHGKERALEMLCLDTYVQSVQQLANHLKKHQRWYRKTVVSGWLVFLRANNEWINHVELVTTVTDRMVTSIGGNVGGMVKQNAYARDDIRIAGYGKIIYEEDKDV